MPLNSTQRSKLKRLGQRVKTFRKEKNLTLKELGHIVDKEPQSIHRLEMGDVNPTYLYLLEVCKGLKVSLQELLGEKEE